jgi:N-acetylneuraminic acid mutarotase
MLLFGGARLGDFCPTVLDDVWTYSPTDGTWTELAPTGPTRPSPRAHHACAWDPARARLWVFGGCGPAYRGLDDLWSFDPESVQWMKVEPPEPRPRGRFSAALHYHPGSDALVLFGGLNGFDDGSTPVHGLWVYDIRANRWVEKTCAAPQLWQCASALDPERGLLILHGGFDEKLRMRSETWTYEVSADRWREPAVGKWFRTAHAGVWDPGADRMLVCGGRGSGAGHDGVWVFAPGTGEWQQYPEVRDPVGGRAYHSAVWDPKTRLMLVFGGTGDDPRDQPRRTDVWSAGVPGK